jgi:hypothetical protein
MKLLDVAQSGKLGDRVAYMGRFGLCHRQHFVPTNPRSEAQVERRRVFGRLAQVWGSVLTEAQREAWNAAGPQVPSKARLGQSGPLTGQQHFQGINSVRLCVGQEVGLMPPKRVEFGPSPVGELVMGNGEDGVRMWLRVTGPVSEAIMVFGQGPCSAGRSKRRRVVYLGLLPAARDGLSEITEM